MRRASSFLVPSDTSTGAAPARPETARSSALASARPASSWPSGTRPRTFPGAARCSIENMRVKAALVVTMRPSRSVVAMPTGAAWKRRDRRASISARVPWCGRSELRSRTSTEIMPRAP